MVREDNGAYAGDLVDKLAELRSQLVGVLDDVPDRAEPSDIDAWFAAFRRVEGAVATMRTRLVRCAQLSRAHEKDGLAGSSSYLSEQLGLSGRDAAKQAKLARDLERLPGTSEALAAGELGADQAAAIGQAARRGALGDAQQTEDQLLDIARTTDTDGLRRRIREEEQRADRQRLVRDERLAHSRRRANLSRREDGMWDLHGQLTGEQGELLAIALDAHRTKDGADVPLPQQRSYEQTTADALAAVVAAALDGGGTTQGGARPQLHIVIPHDVLDEAASGIARTERGGLLSPVLVERMLCDADLRRVLTDGASEVLDIGRSGSKWTVAQRRALHVRDGGCRGPGCDRPPTSCHAHHVQWWTRGGSTAVTNGLLLCSYHHYLVHDGGWDCKVDGRTGYATFTTPDGRELHTIPKGLPATPVRSPARTVAGEPAAVGPVIPGTGGPASPGTGGPASPGTSVSMEAEAGVHGLPGTAVHAEADPGVDEVRDAPEPRAPVAEAIELGLDDPGGSARNRAPP